MKDRLLVWAMILSMLTVFLVGQSAAQDISVRKMRLAKLVIDPAHLEAYRAALKEEIEASVRLERGVLALYAVGEKDNPTRITIIELYADDASYRAHLETPHFKKYKEGTLHMVKSLELTEVDPILFGGQLKQGK